MSFTPLLLLLFVNAVMFAQDSTKVGSDSATEKWSDRIDFHLSAAHYYQGTGSDEEIRMPDYLATRRAGEFAVRNRWGLRRNTITDNPLYHGAGYFDLAADVHPIDGAALHAELVAEGRGWSYGVNDTRNLIAFPRYRISLDTSLTVCGEKFGISLIAGDMLNVRFDEGLTIYNMNIQGSIIGLRWRSLRYYFRKAGDMFAGIGLNVDDADLATVALEDVPLFGDWQGGISVGDFYYPQVPGYSQFFSSTSLATPRSRLIASVGLEESGYSVAGYLADSALGLRLYAQGALRSSTSGDYPISRSAFVGGVHSLGTVGGLQWDGRLEYRYYGGLFNSGFKNSGVYYRDTSRDTYANSIGSHLYSMTQWENPFSQWAVFTEYQDLKETRGVTLQLPEQVLLSQEPPYPRRS